MSENNLVMSSAPAFKELFASAEKKFSGLINFHEKQIGPTLCGPSCLIPILKEHKKLDFTQSELIESSDWQKTVRSSKEILGETEKYAGMASEDYIKAAKLFFPKAELIFSNETSSDFLFKKICQEENKAITVNFPGSALNMPTKGHFANIGAINKKSEKVLLLDPSLEMKENYWIDFESLFQATQIVRPARNKSRGFIIFK